MGAMFKPNQIDPRMSPLPNDQGAGINTNYGINKNPSEGPDHLQRRHYSSLAQYPSKEGNGLNRGSSLRNAGYSYLNGSPNLNNRSMAAKPPQDINTLFKMDVY